MRFMVKPLSYGKRGTAGQRQAPGTTFLSGLGSLSSRAASSSFLMLRDTHTIIRWSLKAADYQLASDFLPKCAAARLLPMPNAVNLTTMLPICSAKPRESQKLNAKI